MVGAALAAALLAQATCARWATSATYDETFYLNCGLATVAEARLDPRLTSHGTAPLPIVLAWLPAGLIVGGEDRFDAWQFQPDDAERLAWARLAAAVATGVPLVLLPYAWLLARRGLWAGALAGGLVCFSPSILAHASLATTDACFALVALIALAALATYGRRPTLPRFLAVAAAIGAAIAAKYSALFLLPVAAIVLTTLAYGRVVGRDGGRLSWRSHGRALAAAGGNLAVLVYLAFVVAWALHQFAFAKISEVVGYADPSAPAWVRSVGHVELPTPVVGIVAQYLHNLRGHAAYLMGEWSMIGWWHYFPCAALFKSTPTELALVLGLMVHVAVRFWRRFQRSRDVGVSLRDVSLEETRPRDWSRLLWWSGLMVYALMMLNVRVQIGQRYLLPLYPLLILIAVDAGAEIGKKRPQFMRAFGVLLLAGQCASAWIIAPHYLAYFSPLVGGPANGAKLLVDSNLDWGQDLPSLRRELERLGDGRLLLYYFGTASPEAYGVRAIVAQRGHFAEWESYDFIAVSLTRLYGPPPLGDPWLYPLKEVEPIAGAGYSILIFDGPAARRAMSEAPLRREAGLPGTAAAGAQ